MNLHPKLDDFLCALIEIGTDPDFFASMTPNDAKYILELTPDGKFHDALRDAMRDNIDCRDDDEI